MAMTSISRSAFSRSGTVLTMKPGVTTLSVGTIDVTGITIDENYSIDISSNELTFTNGSGTRTVTYVEDLMSGGLIKPSLMPDRALTQIYKPADQSALLALDPVQIGDIAINQTNNLSYVALNGDNVDMDDWEPIALASTHDAVGVTSALISNWTSAYDHSQDNTGGTTGNPHGLDYNDVSAIPSIAGTFEPATTNSVHLGTNSKTMGTIYAKEFKFSNANYLPDANWSDVYNHLVGGTGTGSYQVALKSDLIPSGNTEPGYEGDPAEKGGLLQLGVESGEVTSGHTIATLQFYSKDPQLVNIETNDPADSDPRNNVTLPLSVHAEMTVEPEATITNPQTDTLGYGHTVMQDDNGSCNITDDGTVSGGSVITTKAVCEATLVAGETDVYGTWTDDPNDHNVYYQKDASVNFYTGRQKLLSNRFGMMHDGSLMLTSQDWSSYSGREPEPIANYIKILAHKTDNSLYYYTNDGSSDIKKRIVSSAEATANGETVNFNVVNSETITGTTINATTLKINGVEVDLDNLITEFDYWSDPTNTITVTTTAQDWNNTHATEATGQIKIPQLGGLLPTDATLLDVVVLLRWRLTSNTDTVNDNSLDSGNVKLKHSQGTEYALLSGDNTTSFSFSDGSYHTPSGASASGDMILRTCDVGNSSNLETFRDYMSTGEATFYLLLNSMKSNYNNLILRDFSWGIRLYWR